MPITRNALKKLRQDIKRTSRNKKIKYQAKEAIKDFRKKPSESLVPKLFSALDRATKHNVYHKNKTARLKSRLAKLLKKGQPKTETPRTAKKKAVPKKTTGKK